MADRLDLFAGEAFNFEKIAVGAAVSSLDTTKYAVNGTTILQRGESCLISVETNSIRLRFDGVDPDATTGHLLIAGSTMMITGFGSLKNVRMTRATADAVVQVTFFR